MSVGLALCAGFASVATSAVMPPSYACETEVLAVSIDSALATPNPILTITTSSTRGWGRDPNWGQMGSWQPEDSVPWLARKGDCSAASLRYGSGGANVSADGRTLISAGPIVIVQCSSQQGVESGCTFPIGTPSYDNPGCPAAPPPREVIRADLSSSWTDTATFVASGSALSLARAGLRLSVRVEVPLATALKLGTAAEVPGCIDGTTLEFWGTEGDGDAGTSRRFLVGPGEFEMAPRSTCGSAVVTYRLDLWPTDAGIDSGRDLHLSVRATGYYHVGVAFDGEPRPAAGCVALECGKPETGVLRILSVDVVESSDGGVDAAPDAESDGQTLDADAESDGPSLDGDTDR